ncbi:hypothetical protein LCGC14_2156990 [marine sediment metagenome]|uniref:Uncharacterized protein n=1 Tax=marine sediment metagenome TaxID=412755 RepID=A0A0F9GQ51_9ZZZZ
MTTTDIQLEPGHYCYYVPEQDPTEHGGYVPSLVIEDESGHYPMLGNGECAQPWVWGKTIEEARAVADNRNTQKLGLSPERVAQIIASSMATPAGQG